VSTKAQIKVPLLHALSDVVWKERIYAR